MITVLAIDGSPRAEGRTQRALDSVLAGAADAGAATRSLSLADGEGEDRDGPIERALAAVRDSDAFVIGSPVYRASYAAPLKTFLDRLPRGRWGETEAPITARAVAMVMTGATWQHYLAVDSLRTVLAGFFAAHVLAPGLYVPGEGFTEARTLTESFQELARAQGAGVVALAAAIAGAPALGGVTPQV
jgi:FMN reductase